MTSLRRQTMASRASGARSRIDSSTPYDSVLLAGATRQMPAFGLLLREED